MYRFFAKTFGLNLKAITGKNGEIDESGIRIEKADDQLVFSKEFPLPPNALRSHQDITKVFAMIQAGAFK